MEIDYSKEALVRFIQYAAEKGLIKSSSAQGWRVAISKLFVDLSDSEEADVRTINIDVAARKFVNRNSGALSPESLKTYCQRLTVAVEEFTAWSNNPVTYKPRGLSEKSPSTEAKTKQAKTPVNKQSQRTPHSKESGDIPISASNEGLLLSYPIRADSLAQIVIPRDITVAEARRLSAFVQTLAIDFNPGE